MEKNKIFNYSLADVLAFYSTRVKNITRYSEMARNEFLPKNIAVREHPIRFHPNDKDAIHNGIYYLYLLIIHNLKFKLYIKRCDINICDD